jgi:hypothetical protein
MLNIQPDTRLERLAAAAAHPLAELLDCPQDAGRLLNGETKCVDFEPGAVVFRQQGCDLKHILAGNKAYLGR